MTRKRLQQGASRIAAVVCATAAVLLSGCLSLEQMAPPVDPFLLGVASESGTGEGSLRNGRLIYLQNCSKCHAVEPIGAYSETKWEKVLTDMSHEAKLTPERARDVRAYVLAARRSMDRPRPAASGEAR